MSKEIIHFAHANGFPAKTYNKLFSFLEDDYEINYLERHAHNPKFPVTDGWNFLKEELRAEIENRYQQPIIGIGHSLGGILHFLVAVENPELYKSLILLDAPIISRLSGAGIKLLKKTNLLEKYSPARMTRFRRSRWQTREDALRHFKTKSKFADFDAQVLQDYIKYGTIEKNGSVGLFFKPRTEAEIYKTIPHNFARYRGKLKVPTIYIGGTKSREARLARLGFMRKHFPIKFRFVEGSHLFPLESPQLTAQIIKEVLQEPPIFAEIGQID